VAVSYRPYSQAKHGLGVNPLGVFEVKDFSEIKVQHHPDGMSFFPRCIVFDDGLILEILAH